MANSPSSSFDHQLTIECHHYDYQESSITSFNNHHIISIKDPHHDQTTEKQWRRGEDMKPYHHHAIPSFKWEPQLLDFLHRHQCHQVETKSGSFNQYKNYIARL